jgi:hypothetical protein
MKDPPFSSWVNWVNPLFLWWFSIANCDKLPKGIWLTWLSDTFIMFSWWTSPFKFTSLVYCWTFAVFSPSSEGMEVDDVDVSHLTPLIAGRPCRSCRNRRRTWLSAGVSDGTYDHVWPLKWRTWRWTLMNQKIRGIWFSEKNKTYLQHLTFISLPGPP